MADHSIPRRPFQDSVTFYDSTGNVTTFKPTGKPIIVNKRGVAPPPLAARIVVDGNPIELSIQTAALRPKGELLVFERGVYRPRAGKQVSEPGAQVVVFNWEQLDKEKFCLVAYGLASILARASNAPEAFVEVRDGEFAVSSKLVEAYK